MIAAIPAPPLPLVLVAGVLFGLTGIIAIALITVSALEGSRKARAALAALFALGLLVLVWAAIANSAERTLTFTLPLTTAKANASGQIVDCSGGAPVNSLAGWRLYAQIQSPTYATRSRAMLGSADEWARWWPVCAAEAMPRQVRSASSKHMPNGGAGQRVTVSAPDSLDGMPVLAYFVTTFNDSGKVSCPSSTINH